MKKFLVLTTIALLSTATTQAKAHNHENKGQIKKEEMIAKRDEHIAKMKEKREARKAKHEEIRAVKKEAKEKIKAIRAK
ncbi:MAG TPA: hypothetical protein DIV86_06000 [Alphaproteobacteria bacterium]|nr:hypothetical protein [Alphaproteobacteria bacterium]